MVNNNEPIQLHINYCKVLRIRILFLINSIAAVLCILHDMTNNLKNEKLR